MEDLANPVAISVGDKRHREWEDEPARAGVCQQSAPQVRFSPDVQVVPAEAERDPLKEVRVNDILKLHFHCLDGQDHVAAPTFTHQLFDEEKLHVSETSDPSISVLVHMRDMSSRVRLGGLQPAEEEEVLAVLQRALNSSISSFPPGGQSVRSFINRDEQFEILLSNHRNEGTCELVAACERLAMWFIETADAVQFADDKWEALFVYKKGADRAASELVGYLTLYTFINPVFGAKVRICQALVLPRYQQRGLGREMLLATYDMCRSRPEVAEVTVEDPAEGFQHLRDAVDVEWFLRCCGSDGPLIGYDSDSRSLSNALFSSGLTVDMCATHLKITKLQAEFVIDALQYFFLNSDDTVHEAGVPDMKRWRLDVKQRLLKRLPELRLLPKPEMQRELDVAFRDHVQRITAAGTSGSLRALVSGLKLQCTPAAKR